METEKICRTCLGLSGPLLSLYEGGSNGGLCDMLGCFAIKPRMDDKLPDKVCLTCISEINRCYSFKLKCENSDRTLRQLIPDALPEPSKPESTVSSKQVLMRNRSVQTVDSKRPLVTIGVQTIKERKLKQIDQYVQTEVKAQETGTSPTCPLKYEDKPVIADKLKRNVKDNLISRQPKTRRDHSPHLVVKKRATESYFVSEESNDEIVLELQRNELDVINRGTESHISKNVSLQPVAMVEGQDPDDETATYYEITSFDDDNENVYNENQETDDVGYNDVEEEEYTNLIYAAEQSTGTTQQTNFTIFNNENGEAEIIANRPTTRSLSKYKQEPHQKFEFKCPNCIMTFTSEKYLARHIFKRHNSTQKDSEKENAIKKIAVEESTIPSYIVNKKPVKDEFAMPEQIDFDHNNQILTKVPEPSDDKTTSTEPFQFHCEACNAGFAFRKSLRYHQKQNICRAMSYKCDECDRVFITEEKLKEHKETHTMGTACTECNKIFNNADQLGQHMIDDHNRKIRNQCVICKKVFTMLSALKEHMRIPSHSGEKPFSCDICGKSFSQSANLRQHKMRHSKEKKFKCDQCQNSYVTKAELFSHKRSHTGDTPFQCEFCKAQFTTSSSLIKHRRKHTGERPYACEFCPMRFTTLNVLKNHRRTHTGEKPFKCPYCDKSFSQKGDCQNHQRMHTGERKYECSCGAQFNHLPTLRQHRRIHEKEEEQTTSAENLKGTPTNQRDKETDDAMHITIVEEDDEAFESETTEVDGNVVQITVDTNDG